MIVLFKVGEISTLQNYTITASTSMCTDSVVDTSADGTAKTTIAL